MRAQPDQLLQSLREDFRYHLEQFYSCLRLAPPYNSIEKAIRFLSTALQTKTGQEREDLLEEQSLKWQLFEQAFIDSGLPLKHRGIIRGLVQGKDKINLPHEYEVFTKPFLSNS